MGYALLPIEEEYTLLSVGSELMRVIRIELDPMLVLELNRIFILQRYNWSILLFVCPIPE